MAAINVTNVGILDNPSKVTNPLQLEIQYECTHALEDGKGCKDNAIDDVQYILPIY
jgi:hypothetical protein